MKRLLIISYYWPPTGGSGVQRWVKFTKYLSRMGWHCIVYTPSNPEQLARDESLLTEVSPDVEVIKRPIMEPYALYRKFFKASSKGAGVNQLNGQKKTFTQRLAVMARGNLFVPDPRVSWVKPSVRFLARYLKDNPVDAVITTGPPQSMHLIGLGLKERTGVRWMADFRDPWTEWYFFKHMGLFPWTAARHRRLEQKVLDSADTIIAVTPMVQEDFQKRTSTPVVCFTNGYDDDDFNRTAPPLVPGRFSVVHTGIIASDGNPLRLWDVLARKCAEDRGFKTQLRIRLAGKVDMEVVEALRVRGLMDNVDLLGYQPHYQTIAEQRSANLLILPIREEPEAAKILPGKIFEYLAARRPILGIGAENGASAALLKEVGAGVMYDWDRVEPVRNFIDSCWERHLSGDEAPCDGAIEQYSRLNITRRLVEEVL
ncbi:MAG: glycosyltransferase [Bacteroidales bacterium]|nr:glycosyltransferase [Bacteroidales bacterium]